jgi:hypothetical protein
LTLSSGAFAGGSNTASASAVNGVATFGNLVINTAGSYTLAASDGALNGATSSSFTITAATSIFVDFNAGATGFTSNFTVYNNGGANATSLAWGSALGIQDQPGPTAGGGVQSSGGVAIDSTAVYTPSTVNLSDGQVHTISEYVTAVSGLGTGDKPLQIGFLSPTSTGFNGGFSFVSARILGNNTVEFQSANGGAASSSHNTKPTGAITTGDWLKLVLTVQETASGSFQGTFSLIDYGSTGVGAGTTVLAPVSYTVTGLTGLGTAAAVSPGFRTATPASFTGHVRFDNFADPAAAPKAPSTQRPNGGSGGAPAKPSTVAAGHSAGPSPISAANTLTSGQSGAPNDFAALGNFIINLHGSSTMTAPDSKTAVGHTPVTTNAPVEASSGSAANHATGLSKPKLAVGSHAGTAGRLTQSASEMDSLDMVFRAAFGGATDGRGRDFHGHSLKSKPS